MRELAFNATAGKGSVTASQLEWKYYGSAWWMDPAQCSVDRAWVSVWKARKGGSVASLLTLQSLEWASVVRRNTSTSSCPNKERNARLGM
jgi:hypothetical protein